MPDPVMSDIHPATSPSNISSPSKKKSTASEEGIISQTSDIPSTSMQEQVGHLHDDDTSQSQHERVAAMNTSTDVPTHTSKRSLHEEEKVEEAPHKKHTHTQSHAKSGHVHDVSVHQRYKLPSEYLRTLMKLKAQTFTVEGDPGKEPILVCSRQDKIVEVFKGMIARNIYAVPVMLHDKGHPEELHRYYGMISLYEIVKYIVNHFKDTDKMTEEKDFNKLFEEEKEFAEQTVGDLMIHPLSLKNPYHPIIAGFSAFAVMETLGREKGAHRVAIINNRVDRKISNLVTESQVIRWLHNSIDALGDRANKHISECLDGNMIREVVNVSETSNAIDAFDLMIQHGIQGVAIISEEGKLKGNLSLKDLKVIHADATFFWRLNQDIKNFVAKLRKEYTLKHGRPRASIYILPQATIRDVVEQFVKHNIHRVYVCDSHTNRKPIGVVTAQDIILECITP